jgi:hypothetical protein
MGLQLVRLPWLVIERRSSVILGLVIIVMLWVVIGLKYFEDAGSDLRSAERANRNFATIFEENVLRSLGEIDKALLYLRHNVEMRKSTTDFNTIVRTTDVLSDIIVEVAIIDANGILQASNAGPQPTAKLDRRRGSTALSESAARRTAPRPKARSHTRPGRIARSGTAAVSHIATDPLDAR